VSQTPDTKTSLTSDRILDESIGLLRSKGEVGFRLRDVASRLGVTIPNLYRHFSDRDDIVHSAYLREHEINLRQAGQILRSFSIQDFSVDSLWTQFDALLRSVYTDMPKGERIHSISFLHPLYNSERYKQRSVDALHEVVLAAEAIFEKARALDLLKDGLEPNACAVTMCGSILGLVLKDFDDHSTATLDGVMRSIEEIFRSYFR
jgi:AcrR family transcriptional regulator